MLEKLRKYISAKPKRLVLIDAIGASVTTMALGLLLPLFHNLIGLSVNTLHFLSGVAGAIALFSWVCYLGFSVFGKSFIRVIGIVNVFYCLLTASVLLYYYDSITGYGFLYFIGEIMIILFLANAEFKAKVI